MANFILLVIPLSFIYKGLDPTILTNSLVNTHHKGLLGWDYMSLWLQKEHLEAIPTSPCHYTARGRLAILQGSQWWMLEDNSGWDGLLVTLWSTSHWTNKQELYLPFQQIYQGHDSDSLCATIKNTVRSKVLWFHQVGLCTSLMISGVSIWYYMAQNTHQHQLWKAINNFYVI